MKIGQRNSCQPTRPATELANSRIAPELLSNSDDQWDAQHGMGPKSLAQKTLIAASTVGGLALGLYAGSGGPGSTLAGAVGVGAAGALVCGSAASLHDFADIFSGGEGPHVKPALFIGGAVAAVAGGFVAQAHQGLATALTLGLVTGATSFALAFAATPSYQSSN